MAWRICPNGNLYIEIWLQETACECYSPHDETKYNVSNLDLIYRMGIKIRGVTHCPLGDIFSRITEVNKPARVQPGYHIQENKK